jgi:hypothetical protein
VSGTPPTIVIGAPENDGQTGAVYLFQQDGAAWCELQKLTGSDPAGPFPLFGTTIAMSQDTNALLVGAPFDYALGTESGAVHLFLRSGRTWYEKIKIAPPTPGPGQLFGAAIAIDAGTAQVAAHGPYPSSSVYVYSGLSDMDCNHNGIPDACDILIGGNADNNKNGVLDECEASGDSNGDGSTNGSDLVILILNWGACGTACPPACHGDIDGDCMIGVTDLVALILQWTE